VALLRGYLCLQQLVAGLSIVLLLLSLFLLPLGLALNGLMPWLPFWCPAALPLAALAVAAGWIACSCAGVAPCRWLPWTHSKVTVWIDRACLDSSAGASVLTTEQLDHIILKSESVIALVSGEYFRRLWCVYELASVCRQHNRRLFDHLTMLSVEWPSMLSPLKGSTLSAEEQGWLSDFRCRDAECYRPIDRASILDAIRQKWGSEAAFDQFVRERLPAVLEEGKRRYRHQLAREAGRTFELAFGE